MLVQVYQMVMHTYIINLLKLKENRVKFQFNLQYI